MRNRVQATLCLKVAILLIAISFIFCSVEQRAEAQDRPDLQHDFVWVDGPTYFDAPVGNPNTILGHLRYFRSGACKKRSLEVRHYRPMGSPEDTGSIHLEVQGNGTVKIGSGGSSAGVFHRRVMVSVEGTGDSAYYIDNQGFQRVDPVRSKLNCRDWKDIIIRVAKDDDRGQQQSQGNVGFVVGPEDTTPEDTTWNPTARQAVVNPVNPQPGQRSGAQRDPETQRDPTQNTAPAQRRVVVRDCPVGWQKQNAFGHPTPKVFIRSVEVDIDRHRPSGLYKPVAIEIYADPTEGLQDLAGWKLTVAVPYNHGREYRLTAENAVVGEDGIVRIENPDADPFPMTNLTYIGQVLPGFDYRLFSEKNTPVDFAIACYEGTNATLQQLETMEKPRLERTVDPTSHGWNIPFFRSKWRVPVPVAETAPAAPSLSSTQQRLTTMWGTLKKQ